MEDPRIVIVSKATATKTNAPRSTGQPRRTPPRARHREVWVGGLANDYCVKNTVLDAVREGFTVKAIEDAMRAVNLEPHDGATSIEEMAVLEQKF